MSVSSSQVQVTDVADGCAASGLVIKGDTILSINGTPVTDEVQGRALARAAVGKVEFSLLRGDTEVSVTALKPEPAAPVSVGREKSRADGGSRLAGSRRALGVRWARWGVACGARGAAQTGGGSGRGTRHEPWHESI